MTRIGLFVCLGLAAGFAPQAGLTEPYWPAGASVYFVEPQNGAVITGPVKVVMGAKGIEIAPAGTEKPATGHHHILVDMEIPSGDAAGNPMPAEDNLKHFGKGQTETVLTLSPGAHTLQLVLGDGNHVPHEPALKSEQIKITVK
jgi:Domain of unknown function (DUF4399)